MPNEMDVHNIVQHLKNDPNTELMHYELELMLERELAKPDSEIDVQLVEELLKALEEGPSEHEKQSAWESIEKQTRKKAGWKCISTTRRLVASVLILFSILTISVGSAYAFNWKLLLRFLTPLAETFGIYSSNGLTTQPPEQSDILYIDEDTGYKEVYYTSAKDMPSEWNNFRVQPVWLPERFSFIQGSMYMDDSVGVFSATYTAGESFFNLTTTFFSDDEAVSSYEYQKIQDDPILEIIGNREVTYYLNSDTLNLAASWIDQNVHYSVFGNINEEEMRNIVLGIIE